MRFTMHTATIISPMKRIAPSAARTMSRMFEEESTPKETSMLVWKVLRFKNDTDTSVPDELIEMLYWVLALLIELNPPLSA